MKVDMSPEAVTGRMMMLDQLWELAVALRNSKLGSRVEETAEPSPNQESKKADQIDPPS